jgi:hypothetical protein
MLHTLRHGPRLYYQKRKGPRPADWGVGMTVCINAIAGTDEAIISVTDQMLGAGDMTADLPRMLKGKRIADTWTASFAGNDITVVHPILGKTEALLSNKNGLTDVAQAFVEAYSEERARVAEETILRPLGLTMETFRAALLGAEPNVEVAELRQRIQALNFKPTFIVSGFSDDGSAHIFTVEAPGTAAYFTNLGFWAIGSGAEAALSNLFYRKYDRYLSLPEALYLVAEAKFMAESSAGVGRHSFFHILKKDHTSVILMDDDIAPLREIWEREGRAPMPEHLERRVSEVLRPELFVPMTRWIAAPEHALGEPSTETS